MFCEFVVLDHDLDTCLSSVPQSLRLSLPSPKTKGKRTPAGKKSPRQSTPAKSPGQRPSPEAASPVALSQGTSQEESGLEDLTKGLLSLDLNTTTSANNSPSSVPVGGARRKVKPSPQKGSEMKAEATPEKVTSNIIEEESKNSPQGDGQSANETQVNCLWYKIMSKSLALIQCSTSRCI